MGSCREARPCVSEFKGFNKTIGWAVVETRFIASVANAIHRIIQTKFKSFIFQKIIADFIIKTTDEKKQTNISVARGGFYLCVFRVKTKH
jgi:hypothetical protein